MWRPHHKYLSIYSLYLFTRMLEHLTDYGKKKNTKKKKKGLEGEF